MENLENLDPVQLRRICGKFIDWKICGESGKSGKSSRKSGLT